MVTTPAPEVLMSCVAAIQAAEEPAASGLQGLAVTLEPEK